MTAVPTTNHRSPNHQPSQSQTTNHRSLKPPIIPAVPSTINHHSSHNHGPRQAGWHVGAANVSYIVSIPRTREKTKQKQKTTRLIDDDWKEKAYYDDAIPRGDRRRLLLRDRLRPAEQPEQPAQPAHKNKRKGERLHKHIWQIISASLVLCRYIVVLTSRTKQNETKNERKKSKRNRNRNRGPGVS